MSRKLATIAVLATALAAAPISSAHADGWHHGHGGFGGGHHGDYDFGLLGGIVGLGAVVTGAAVALVSAPFYAIGEAAAPPPPVYAPAPPAYAPAPQAYAQPPQSYYYGYPSAYAQRRVVYAYPQAYYAPAYAPAYYAPAYGYPPQ
jgi:hypothetical protein